MPDPTPHPPAGGTSAARVTSFVLATFVALVSLGFLAAGGALLWGNAQKDADGYISTSSDHFGSSGYAVESDDLDVDLDAPDWVVDHGRFGRIRLEATSRTGKPVFVGIAPTRDVDAYLRNSARSTVEDLDYGPFDVSYREHGGDRAPGAPTGQDFWAASAQGTGTRTMTWKVRDGQWSVVVMNADGSRGVDVGVSAGASVPFLAPLGWGSLGVGLVLAVGAGGLLYLGARRPRPAAPQPLTAA